MAAPELEIRALHALERVDVRPRELRVRDPGFADVQAVVARAVAR